MKYLAVPLILVLQLSSPVVAGSAAKQKTPFFRPRNFFPARPSQAPGTIVVVNAASFLPGISPGDLSTIFGQDLTDVTGVVVAQTNPLPTELAHVTVTVNDIPAPLFSIAFANGQDQISFQVPYETPTGPGAATIQVFDYGNLEATVNVDSFTEDPGIFAYSGNFAVATFADGSLIGPDNAANPGDVIVLYTTGLGPLNQDLIDGVGAPSNPPASTTDPFQVLVAGRQCQVFFSGLAPGFVGLYQINLVLPSNLPPGNLDIQLLSDFANSNVAQLAVQ